MCWRMYALILGIISVVTAGGAVYEISKKNLGKQIGELSDAELHRYYHKQKVKTKKSTKNGKINQELLNTVELELKNRKKKQKKK